jgi:protein SCO1/2
MNTNLGLVQNQYKEDTNVLILSHTVDPKTDDIPRLKAYSLRMGGIRNKWHFVTGREEDIYELARKSYFVATPKDSTLNEDFVHSQLICLIDPHPHIRGYYDGTNGKDVKKLIEDIQKLKIEYNKDGRQKTIDLFPYFRNK